MDKPILSVCIPSYDRVEKAQQCVASLLEQVDDRLVNITVLDNGSDQDYGDVFGKNPTFSSALNSGLLKIHRNIFNIGMSANFMRSFELADGRWLWILSDDDEIRSNALSNILAEIDEHGEKCAFIKFSSVRSRPDQEHKQIKTLEEFIDFNGRSNNDFNSFLFISNGIYRLDAFKPLMSVGYHYANTFIPHFMMLVTYIAHGNRCVITRKEIVDYVVPEVGYSYGMLAGLGVGAPKHSLLKLSPEYYRKFLRLFFPHNDFKVIIDLYVQCERDATPYVCRHLVACYLNYVSVARSTLQMLVIRCFGYLVRFPWLFRQVMLYGEKLNPTIRRHVIEINRRYE